MSVDILSLLPARPPVAALSMADRILVWSMREWLRAALAQQPVTITLRCGLDNLGMADVAAPMAQFMEEATALWPDRLRLFPTGCGCPISYDEWLLLACLTDAGHDMRDIFDARLGEMIGLAGRNRLWAAATRLMASAGRLTIGQDQPSNS